jgi:hypothetical protein
MATIAAPPQPFTHGIAAAPEEPTPAAAPDLVEAALAKVDPELRAKSGDPCQP